MEYCGPFRLEGYRELAVGGITPLGVLSWAFSEGRGLVAHCPGCLMSEPCDRNSLSFGEMASSLLSFSLFSPSLCARKWHQALHPVGWAGAKAVTGGGVGPQTA